MHMQAASLSMAVLSSSARVFTLRGFIIKIVNEPIRNTWPDDLTFLFELGSVKYTRLFDPKRVL